MFSKKKRMGIQPKVRTLDEINQDYNYHAAQAGHKRRIVFEIEGEIEEHINRMLTINTEAKAIPKEEAAQTTPPSETSTEGGSA